jgi:hypothetical protein
MLKNFKSGYAVSGSDQTAKGETNDCVVRAIANACDVNYDQAHSYVADTFKRKKGEGTRMFMSTLDGISDMVFNEVGQLNMFDDGITRTLKPLGKGPKQGGKLINPKYKHKPVAFTVKAFAQKYKRGNFILAVNKHALAVNDGVVVDNGNYQFDGYRRVVEGAYQVQQA